MMVHFRQRWDRNEKLRIAFASCHHAYTHPHQSAWLDLAARQPDGVLLMGDNVYLEKHIWQLWCDKPVNRSDQEFAVHLHQCYQRQWAVPEFRQMLRELHDRGGWVRGTVDDHDFLGDDQCVSPATQQKACMARALFLQFIECCGNPAQEVYPPLPASIPAQWQALDTSRFSAGLGLACRWQQEHVQLLMLDNRSYREPKAPHARALGPEQMAWIEANLEAHDRPGHLTLVASGSPLSRGSVKCVPGSPLSDYPAEYAELLALYARFSRQTILHLGGDVHYNDWKDRDPVHGHYQVVSSALGSGALPFSCKARGNFGILDAGLTHLRVRTFGAQSHRNVDRLILL